MFKKPVSSLLIFLTAVLLSLSVQAQETENLFFDDFDSYANGSEIIGQGGWFGFFNNANAGALVSNSFAHSAPNSLEVVGDSDVVQLLNGAAGGTIIVSAWQYIPTGFSGRSYFILQNRYDHACATCNWSLQVAFESGTGNVESEFDGGTLPYVTDRWVEIRVEINLAIDVQDIYYDGQLLASKSWTDGLSGNGALVVADIDLFANNASEVYYDDVSVDRVIPDAIPTMNQWGMLILILLAGLGAGIAIKRRQVAS